MARRRLSLSLSFSYTHSHSLVPLVVDVSSHVVSLSLSVCLSFPFFSFFFDEGIRYTASVYLDTVLKRVTRALRVRFQTLPPLFFFFFFFFLRICWDEEGRLFGGKENVGWIEGEIERGANWSEGTGLGDFFWEVYLATFGQWWGKFNGKKLICFDNSKYDNNRG